MAPPASLHPPGAPPLAARASHQAQAAATTVAAPPHVAALSPAQQHLPAALGANSAVPFPHRLLHAGSLLASNLRTLGQTLSAPLAPPTDRLATAPLRRAAAVLGVTDHAGLQVGLGLGGGGLMKAVNC